MVRIEKGRYANDTPEIDLARNKIASAKIVVHKAKRVFFKRHLGTWTIR